MEAFTKRFLSLHPSDPSIADIKDVYVFKREREGWRERERGRETETERHTYIQTDRQTDRQNGSSDKFTTSHKRR